MDLEVGRLVSRLHREKKSPRFSPRNVNLGMLKLNDRGGRCSADAAHGTYNMTLRSVPCTAYA